jgi:uncharacterized membrane protein YqjE
MTENDQNLGAMVNEISERASLLVREEIELAKAEIQQKINRLVKGAVVGALGGIFAVVGLLFLLHAAAWGIWAGIFNAGSTDIYAGFLVLAGILFLLGGLAAFLAIRFFKRGSPPTPQMAIEEAKLIRETVSGDATPAPVEPVGVGDPRD